MRQLIAKDLGPFTKLISKMELKETIRKMFSPENKKDKKNKKDRDGEMLSELICGIIENYHKAENEFFKFLANLEEKTVAEIEELPLPDFINLITELFSRKNIFFFKSAVQSTQRK